MIERGHGEWETPAGWESMLIWSPTEGKGSLSHEENIGFC